MATRTAADVSVGKFEILASYTYAKALLDGADESEAKERGMVAAIMGARSKLGSTRSGHENSKKAAEKTNKTTITAASFDRRVASRMGPFFGRSFLPAMKRLARAGLSYEQVKRLLQIPGTWGAKISGREFRERAVPPNHAAK